MVSSNLKFLETHYFSGPLIVSDLFIQFIGY